MGTNRVLFTTMLVVLISIIGASAGGAAPEGQMTWAVHISLAPTWFDPAETPGIITLRVSVQGERSDRSIVNTKIGPR